MAQLHESDPALAGAGTAAGAAYWTLGLLLSIRVHGGDTDGRFSVSEFVCGPGFATPLHLHHREDETWWVIEGRIRFRCGEKEFEAEPGDCVYLPRGVPHGFKVVGSENGRMVDLAVPAGPEAFHAELGGPAGALTVPPSGPEPGPAEVARIVEVGNRYGIEVLGPPIA